MFIAASRFLRRNCREIYYTETSDTNIVIVVMASPLEILKEMKIVNQAMRDLSYGKPDIEILIQEISALLIELQKDLNIPDSVLSEEVIEVNKNGG